MSDTPLRVCTRALDTHAEREARVLVRVDAARDEDVRVDHAAAAPLDPALGSAGATRASGLSTDAPRQAKHCKSISADGSVNGKYDGTPPGDDALAEHRGCEVIEGAAEVGHADALVDGEPSTCVKTGECVASNSSVRNTRPGQIA